MLPTPDVPVPSSIRTRDQAAQALTWIAWARRQIAAHRAAVEALEGEVTAAVSRLVGRPTTLSTFEDDLHAGLTAWALKHQSQFPAGARRWELPVGAIGLREKGPRAVCELSRRADVAKAISRELDLPAKLQKFLSALKPAASSRSRQSSRLGRWLRLSATLHLPSITEEFLDGRCEPTDLERFGIEIDDLPEVTVSTT